MIEDRRYRQALTEKFLEAETTVEEEMLLAEYYAHHSADAGEEAVSRLVLADHPVTAPLSDEGAASFDDAVRAKTRGRVVKFAAVFAAAALALFFIIRPHMQSPACGDGFSTLEIAQSLNTIINLDLQDIESIVAEPKGAKVILTAKMKDGSSSTFIMSRDQEDGSTKILAQHKTKKP